MFGVTGIAQIRGHRDGPPTRRLDLTHKPIQLLRSSRRHQHGTPGARQPVSNHGPKSRGRPGHDGGLPVQAEKGRHLHPRPGVAHPAGAGQTRSASAVSTSLLFSRTTIAA